MILPAFSTTTTSPGRTSLRSISSALCRLARLTVVPASSTGSRSATGVIAPVFPTWTRMALQPRGGLVLLELVGDHPARAFRRAAEPLALVEAIDLEHQAVDLEIQLVQPLDQLLAVVDGGGERRKALDVGRGRQAVAAKLCQKLHVGLGLQPAAVAGTVAKEPQPPLGADARIELADAAGHRVAGVFEQRLARRSSCRWLKRTRSELVM